MQKRIERIRGDLARSPEQKQYGEKVPYMQAMLFKNKKEFNTIIDTTMNKPFCENIENEALKNKNFRKVLYTSTNVQVVLMSLLPEEEIGLETHDISDQFFRVESGEGKAVIDGEKFVLSDGVALVVPAGSKHNIMNTSKTEPLKFYTLYMPPHHKDGVIHKTKAEAERDKKDHL